jgi:hypothetical protein
MDGGRGRRDPLRERPLVAAGGLKASWWPHLGDGAMRLAKPG